MLVERGRDGGGPGASRWVWVCEALATKCLAGADLVRDGRSRCTGHCYRVCGAIALMVREVRRPTPGG